jgi:putative transposase
MAIRDWDDFVTFYYFPADHWLHLRTSNPIDSVFAGVRLRTNVAKRARVRENALYLVFKIVERLATRWRVLNGGATVMALVLAGERFVDASSSDSHHERRNERPDRRPVEGSFHAT